MNASESTSPPPMIAIIGAGFSGTALAIQLARRLAAGRRVLLIERDERPGPGLAYGTLEPHHLLNVPAKSMSLFPDKADDFLRWLETQPPEAFGPLCDGPAPDAFVPRALYGAYLRERLAEALATGRIELLRADVTSVTRKGEGFALSGPGFSAEAGQVVLATGNPPPGVSDLPWLAGDPWQKGGALEGLAPEAPLLLVGAGLTMVDLVLTLRARGHVGPIHVISRHGWAPLPHAEAPLPAPWPVPEQASGTPFRAILPVLREAAEAAAAAGTPWQSVPDGIRPQIQRLWQAASPVEKARFLRHAATLWAVHRHRISPRLADALEKAKVSLEAARLLGWEKRGEAVQARLRPRGGGEKLLDVARIILCTGPGADRGWLKAQPLAGLIEAGLARPEPLALGLDFDPATLAMHDAEGAPVPGLFVLGPTAKGMLWEATAVPELRGMAAKLAERLLA
ncbi:FAD/NAD(P)-binding protein [Acetobacteraceae bacterium H6797]|nr:FAD/NAD(P)-binding protein [Acetobacteraceae bacterium H6797]